MATTTTARLGFKLQAAGDNPGAWEVDLNQGLQDAEDRFFKSGIVDPNTDLIESDYIGAELFAAAVACSRAMALAKKGEPGALELADVFSRQSRRRVESLFEHVFDNDDVATYRLAQRVLGGGHRWLEEGLPAV